MGDKHFCAEHEVKKNYNTVIDKCDMDEPLTSLEGERLEELRSILARMLIWRGRMTMKLPLPPPEDFVAALDELGEFVDGYLGGHEEYT